MFDALVVYFMENAQELFAEAYKKVFTIIDLALATAQDIENAMKCWGDDLQQY